MIIVYLFYYKSEHWLDKASFKLILHIVTDDDDHGTKLIWTYDISDSITTRFTRTLPKAVALVANKKRKIVLPDKETGRVEVTFLHLLLSGGMSNLVKSRSKYFIQFSTIGESKRDRQALCHYDDWNPFLLFVSIQLPFKFCLSYYLSINFMKCFLSFLGGFFLSCNKIIHVAILSWWAFWFGRHTIFPKQKNWTFIGFPLLKRKQYSIVLEGVAN